MVIPFKFRNHGKFPFFQQVFKILSHSLRRFVVTSSVPPAGQEEMWLLVRNVAKLDKMQWTVFIIVLDSAPFLSFFSHEHKNRPRRLNIRWNITFWKKWQDLHYADLQIPFPFSSQQKAKKPGWRGADHPQGFSFVNWNMFNSEHVTLVTDSCSLSHNNIAREVARKIA